MFNDAKIGFPASPRWANYRIAEEEGLLKNYVRHTYSTLQPALLQGFGEIGKAGREVRTGNSEVNIPRKGDCLNALVAAQTPYLCTALQFRQVVARPSIAPVKNHFFCILHLRATKSCTTCYQEVDALRYRDSITGTFFLCNDSPTGGLSL